MVTKFCQCTGLAAFILVLNYADLLGGGADVRMHFPFQLSNIVLAHLIEIFLLGLLLFAIIATLSRMPFYPAVRLLLAIVVPPLLIDRARTRIPFMQADAVLVLFTFLWLVFVLLLRFRFSGAYGQLMRTGYFVSIAMFVFAVGSFGQLLYISCWKPGPFQAVAPWSVSQQPPRQHSLLVWVIFDELSYDQVFEHRASGLSLPNFDSLRSGSTVFTDVQPVAYETAKAIPSILTGRSIDDLVFTFDDRMMVHYAGQTGFHLLDGTGTVFAEAQRTGWRTGIVGWWNPYCTTYKGSIDNCYFMNLDRLEEPMAEQNTLWQNVWYPLRQAAREIFSPATAQRDMCTFDVRQRIKTYADLEEHAQELLHADQTDFVLIHLPVPHSPNIWSRKANGYTQVCGSSYLDSLTLADRELGKILAVLNRSPRWKDTTLIVQGDHSWRTKIWDREAAWTKEDSAASRGIFDPRPAVIIHQPGQTRSEIVSTPWPLINIHGVIEQTIQGKPITY